MSFALVVKWTVREGELEHVEQALRNLAAPTRAEPGCEMWLPHRDLDDANVLFIYERYENRAAYDAHVESEHFERWGKGEALPRLESRERGFFETLDF